MSQGLYSPNAIANGNTSECFVLTSNLLLALLWAKAMILHSAHHDLITLSLDLQKWRASQDARYLC
eukprot:CAMPEP_0115524456 /NCGR_PEP_ID=MMETSP0271-20121206/81194_1 /TAXON_ID=71861 /ORGANISM="Scrippsiella trochoidea, Strain CCMP3099" /LENGTH=65 /DNA_ID=CAMNT_0002955965 /DNA_START=786 /DNA_END=980 /DNA_ORIENTATION=-